MTNRRTLHLLLTFAYTILVAWVYQANISTKWSYIGFRTVESAPALATILSLSVGLSIFIPSEFSTRSFLLLVAHFAFFIPSFIILASNGLEPSHFLSLLISFSLIFSISALPFKRLGLRRLPIKTYFLCALSFLALTVLLMLAFNGLSHFNLNLLKVYEFRRDAESNMPGIFQYIFSGVSKVVAPISLILAIRLRSKTLLFTTIVGIILLFGLTSHKSVLLLPVFVLVFFWVLKNAQSLNSVLYLFVSFVILGALEALYYSYFQLASPGLLNTMLTRRALFIPPLTDSYYVEFFADQAKLYWSTSRFGFGIASNPYETTAPFLIGLLYFENEATSANTGMIGSGFSHAGYVGVAIYSTLIGALLALLQAYGRSIGHAFTSSISLPIFISIVTTTDFTTAILTHGLLLLVVSLMFAPKAIGDASKG